MTLRESRRMQEVKPPIVPVVERMIRAAPGTISLGQGMVGFGPPREAIDALASFNDEVANHRYGPVDGLPPLIRAVEAKLEADNGIWVHPQSRVVVTAGSNMAFVHAVLAIADIGDEIILVAPYYFNHEMAVVMAGCRPVTVAVDEQYQLRPEAMRRAITPRTRAIVTISPNNPTGVVYPEDALRAVNAICHQAGVYHIHDEAYEYFLFGSSRHFSPGSLDDAGAHTISLFSLSKAYGFASWRIGYMVVPESLGGAIDKIQDTILVCPPAVSQHAAVAALTVGGTYCRQQLPGLAESRQILLDALTRLSDVCTVPQADGAMYYLVRVRARIGALELVARLIREHGVAAIPGTAFGLTDGCYLRVSYGALDHATAVEGAARLATGLRTILS